MTTVDRLSNEDTLLCITPSSPALGCPRDCMDRLSHSSLRHNSHVTVTIDTVSNHRTRNTARFPP